jgi:rhodanese-related sulfurtransferase
MGYKNVKNMAGGWKAWEKTGYPLQNIYVVKGGSL